MGFMGLHSTSPFISTAFWVDQQVSQIIRNAGSIAFCEWICNSLLLRCNVQGGKGLELRQGLQDRKDLLPGFNKICFVQIAGAKLLLYIPVTLSEYGDLCRRVIFIILIQKLHRKGSCRATFAAYMYTTVPVNGSKNAKSIAHTPCRLLYFIKPSVPQTGPVIDTP